MSFASISSAASSNRIEELFSIRSGSFEGREIVNSTRSGSFEGREIVNVRANACKVSVVFTLVLIGSVKLGSLCFDDQEPDVSGLTSRTYEAVNTSLLVGLLIFQYTRGNEKLKNPFQTGKICSYEFFAALIAAHTVAYSYFFLASSSKDDPLSAGIYGASLGTVLESYASVYKEHDAACKLDAQDEYHCIENLPAHLELRGSQTQSEDFIAEGRSNKICNIAKASIPLLWGIGSASFASLCFSGQNGLTPRVYEVMSVGLAGSFLAMQQIRSDKQLKNPLQEGRACSYELLATVVGSNTVAYSLIFAANASKAGPLSAAIYGGTLSATLGSYASVFKEHVNTSKKEHVRHQIGSFFDYANDRRHVSVAVNDDSLHSAILSGVREYMRVDSSRPFDERSLRVG